MVCEHMGLAKKLLERRKLSSAGFPAERPAYICLDVTKVESVLHQPQPYLDHEIESVGIHSN